MKRGSWQILSGGVVLLLTACSSSAAPGGGAGGRGTGGASAGNGGSGAGGTGVALDGGDFRAGACLPGVVNPDSEPGGACAADCQSVSCGQPCTQDCCVPCGPEGTGIKICRCPLPGQPFSNCTCTPGPTSQPTGGPCSPQGYATTALPGDAPDGSISLQGASCSRIGVICLTADSTVDMPRACICEPDGRLHCLGLSLPRPNNGVPTPYN